MTPVQGQDGDDSVVRGGRSDGVSWIPLSSASQKAQSTLWSPSQNYTMALFVSEQGCEIGEGGVKSLGLELSSSLSLNVGLGGDDTADLIEGSCRLASPKTLADGGLGGHLCHQG